MKLPSKAPVLGEQTSLSEKPKDASVIKKGSNITASSPLSSEILTKNVQGILPKTVLSEEEKNQRAQKLERKYKITCALKKISTIFVIITILFFVFLKVTLSPKNSFLSIFGIDKNLGSLAQEEQNKNLELEMQNFETTSKIASFEKKIKNKHYTLFSEDIKKIKKSQLTWFDDTNPQGEVEIGVIDGINRVADYLNDNEYSDPNNIINGRYEEVKINDVSANRKSVSFSATTTQILGNIIFMDIEFIDVLNSFPIYKNGKHLSNFQRQKNEDGDYSTAFSMSLDIQHPGEESTDDERFVEYAQWFENKYPGLKTKNYKITNK